MPRVAAKEAAFAALLDRLAGAVAEPVERNRTAAVDEGEMPRVVLTDGGHTASDDAAAGLTVYSVEFLAEGFVDGATPGEGMAALHDLHARVVAGLCGSPTALPGAVTEVWPREAQTEIETFEANESATPCAVFRTTLRFDLLVPFDGPFFDIP